MKIEMMENVKHDRLDFAEGEIRVVDDAVGAYFCEMGWAKDVEGKVETKPREPRDVRLVPENVVHGLKNQDMKLRG